MFLKNGEFGSQKTTSFVLRYIQGCPQGNHVYTYTRSSCNSLMFIISKISTAFNAFILLIIYTKSHLQKKQTQISLKKGLFW